MTEKKQVTIIDHGVVLRQSDRVFGYNGWPSVAVNGKGEILVVASGLRAWHICPFGKVILKISRDEGKSWLSPMIALDTPLDDRDAGILNVGNGKMILSSFNNGRSLQNSYVGEQIFSSEYPMERAALTQAYVSNVTDEMEEKYLGSLLSVSEDDGYTWSEPYRAPVTAPHGPNLMRDGSLIYAGNPYEGEEVIKSTNFPQEYGQEFAVSVYKSENHRDFHKLADIPVSSELGTDYEYCEPHIIELPSGRLIVHIRVDEYNTSYEKGVKSIVQSTSDDGGRTWSPLRLLGCKNGPAHLLLHSSGILLSAYGRRVAPFGVQAMFSRDEGETWDMGYSVWDEGVDEDLGYPCSVELSNGDIFTVYYGKLPGDKLTSILWTRWRLPDFGF